MCHSKCQCDCNGQWKLKIMCFRAIEKWNTLKTHTTTREVKVAKVNEKLMFAVFVKYHWKYKCQGWFILQIVLSLLFIGFDIKIQGEMDVNLLKNCWPTFIVKKLCMEATKRFSSELLTLSYPPLVGGGLDFFSALLRVCSSRSKWGVQQNSSQIIKQHCGIHTAELINWIIGSPYTVPG